MFYSAQRDWLPARWQDRHVSICILWYTDSYISFSHHPTLELYIFLYTCILFYMYCYCSRKGILYWGPGNGSFSYHHKQMIFPAMITKGIYPPPNFHLAFASLTTVLLICYDCARSEFIVNFNGLAFIVF